MPFPCGSSLLYSKKTDVPVNKVKSGKQLKIYVYVSKKHRKKVQHTVINNFRVWRSQTF